MAKIINQKASFFYFCRSSDQSADQLLKIVLMISQLQEASQQNKHPEKMYTLDFLVELTCLEKDRIGSLVDSMRSRGGGRGIVVEGSLVGRKWDWYW